MKGTAKLAIPMVTGLLFLCGTAFCQPDIPPPDDDFNLFLLVFALAAIVGMLVIFFLLIVLVLGAIAALSAAGALSVASLHGWQKRSLSAGFRTFIRVGFAIGGGLLAAVAVFVLLSWFHFHGPVLLLSLGGFVAGAGGGWLLAVITLALLRWVLRLVKEKMRTLPDANTD